MTNSLPVNLETKMYKVLGLLNIKATKFDELLMLANGSISISSKEYITLEECSTILRYLTKLQIEYFKKCQKQQTFVLKLLANGNYKVAKNASFFVTSLLAGRPNEVDNLINSDFAYLKEFFKMFNQHQRTA